MTWKEKIENLFKSGVFAIVQKLLMVLYFWALGRLSDSDAKALFTECGYTFTKPTTIDQIILISGTTSYTIISLITAYHDNYYSLSQLSSDDIFDMIDHLHSSGYITTDEQTLLKGLGW